MTYTIIGRCAETGQLGLGIATYSLGVGGYCPFVKADVAVLSSQAFADPRLRTVAMRLLEAGNAPAEVLKTLRHHDPHFDYRQVGIVDKNGVAAAWTGPRTRAWAGQRDGPGWIAMGNVLAGPGVVEAMAQAWEVNGGVELHERLLRVLEAGRDAGGQQNAAGRHLEERSAALLVHDREEYALMDLRVDAHLTSVEELRRVRDAYLPYVDYYEMRIKDPPNTPPQDAWPVRPERSGD